MSLFNALAGLTVSAEVFSILQGLSCQLLLAYNVFFAQGTRIFKKQHFGWIPPRAATFCFACRSATFSTRALPQDAWHFAKTACMSHGPDTATAVLFDRMFEVICIFRPIHRPPQHAAYWPQSQNQVHIGNHGWCSGAWVRST